ncbi:MAG TPA: hypothetical protein VLB02_00245 [Candidatus Paceibacterota bacterium]|nr:hypothetical protein [Candidatus Paceibacterota bacterium]
MAIAARPTQDFVQIKEVRDGIVMLLDGSLASVILVSSVNLSLKSYDEQQATLMQFQNFLNSLDFSIQIVIQSRRYDIRPYILTLENRVREQQEPLLRIQTQEYIEFIRTFTEQVNIMRKSFYVVIPYSPAILGGKKGFFANLLPSFGKSGTGDEPLKDFEEQRTQLEQRVGVVEQGLSRLGVRSVQLGTQEIIELFYRTFNPGETTSEAKSVSAPNA